MEEDNRIRLKVLGLSVGQIKQGAYALILAQEDGPVRIPVVIGETEARAIASRMERVVLPRPLVYDLFASMAHAFGVTMKEVFIHKFEDGIFHSEVTFTDGETSVQFDSRTSDAIAIAMRTGAPIFTTREIMETCGFVMDESPATARPDSSSEPPSLDELRRRRDEAVEREDYEEAARITEIINKIK